jgi:hypothetical protein
MEGRLARWAPFAGVVFVVLCVIAVGLVIDSVWAISALSWRTRTLPRWLSGLAFFVGATCVVGFIGIPGLIPAVWLLLLSGYLTWSRMAAAPVATT